MSKQDNGGPAFPTLGRELETEGMTLRDYFAAKALPIAYDHFSRDLSTAEQDGHDFVWGEINDTSGDCLVVAEAAYAMADAMLKARQQ